MRRIIALLAITVLTALAFAPPAGAIPKEAQEWDQWCDLNGDGSLETYFAVTGDHNVGWALPWGPGDSVSGGIFVGGDQTVTLPDGSIIEADVEPHPGLVAKVTRCRVTTEFPDGATYLADPAWIFFPPGAVRS